MKTGLVMWWFGSIFEMPPVRFGASMPGSASITLSGSVDCHLLDRLHPHGEADNVGFHRVVGGALRVLGEVVPFLDEVLVGRRLDRLEVVPGGEMADQRLGVETGELFFADRERHDRDVGRLDALVAELL